MDEQDNTVDYNKSFSEAFSIMQLEISQESTRKENLENRAGMLLAFISAFFMLSFNTISSGFIEHNSEGYSMLLSFRNFMLLAFWICYFITAFKTLRVLLIKKYQNFSIDKHIKALQDKQYANQTQLEQHVLNTYSSILLHNREINTKKATHLQHAMISLMASFVFFFIASILK